MCIMPYIFYKLLDVGFLRLKKYLGIILFLIASVLITGERMSFLMYVFYYTLFFSLILFLLNKKNSKKLLIFFSIFILLFSFLSQKLKLLKIGIQSYLI